MNRDRPIALLDTNVWLDHCLGDRPGSYDSREFLSKALSLEVQLTYAIHSLSDFFYLIQLHLKSQACNKGTLTESEALAIKTAAWTCVEEVRSIATAIGADESDAWRACKYRTLNNDLEDNFVLAAAERVPVDFLVTNDTKLIRKSTVNAYTPADAILMLEATQR